MPKNKSKLKISLTINSTKMDFLTLVEHEIVPPIAFRNRTALLEWAKSQDIKERRVGRRSPHDVLLIEGRVKREFVSDDEGFLYSQVWVRAKYRYYRDAISFHIRNVEGQQIDISMHDADHAVARSHFVKNKDRRKRWPDAWINLLMVESGVNRAVGSMMESMDSRIDFNGDRVHFNAECLLKTFYNRTEKLSREEIGEYLSDAAERFISSYGTLDDVCHTFNADLILRDVAQKFNESLEIRTHNPFIIVH